MAEIEQIVQEMRSNQAAKLSFNGITLDGTGNTGVMTSGTGNVVDGTGLVSTVNFPSTDLFNAAANLSTASTSFIDVTGGTIGTITTDRTIRVLFFLLGTISNDDFIPSLGAHVTEVHIFDDFTAGSLTNIVSGGEAFTHIVNLGGGAISWTEGESDALVEHVTVLGIAAGTHNLKLQYRAVSGGTAFLTSFETGYVILGS